MPSNLENSAIATGLERVIFSFQSQRKAMSKSVQTTAQLHSFHMLGTRGFPCSSVGKESACSAGDQSLIPGLGRSPGEGNGNPLLYSCLENPMVRGAWWATVHGVAKSWTRLSDFTFIQSSASASPKFPIQPLALSATTSLFSMSVSPFLFHR